MWDCKKVKGPDFRDSMVGIYNCIEHYHAHSDPSYDYDSVIGPAVISVSKSSTNDSSIIVNGNVFHLLQNNSGQPLFLTNSSPTSFTNFTIQNDSIWTDSVLFEVPGRAQMLYYTGHKQ